MIEVIENSDLLSIENGIICHQVNCLGLMGAGLALQIKKKWPYVFEAYQQECKTCADDPKQMLGHVQDVLIKTNLVVANCFGQVDVGRNSCMTDYKAWDIMLDKLKDISSYFNLSLHFPWMIGCGLAGGDWNLMLKKIDGKFGKDKQKVFIHKL